VADPVVVGRVVLTSPAPAPVQARLPSGRALLAVLAGAFLLARYFRWSA
jgi:hypothetical protein